MSEQTNGTDRAAQHDVSVTLTREQLADLIRGEGVTVSAQSDLAHPDALGVLTMQVAVADPDAAPSLVPVTWADGYGVWHVRVRRSLSSPLYAARRALRDELLARDAKVTRAVWMHPVRVEELDDAETIVLREGPPENVGRPTFDTSRPLNDPTTACCERDAADCDCPGTPGVEDHDAQLQALIDRPHTAEAQVILDEMVTELTDQIASGVNNDGFSVQVDYLLANGIEADDILRRLL